MIDEISHFQSVNSQYKGFCQKVLDWAEKFELAEIQDYFNQLLR